VASTASTGTLKSFIKGVGLLLMLLGAWALLVAAFGVIKQTVLNGFRLEMIVAGPLILGFYAVVVFFGWRMFRDWNRSTIQLYALIQVILSGILVGHVGNLYWPHMGPALGGFFMLWMGRYLEIFLLRYFGLSRNPSPPAAASVDDVSGTPWQGNPGYTAR
jgi:hypothetical protein